MKKGYLQDPLTRPVIVLLLLSLLAVLIYSNTFFVPFQVDDFGNIVDYDPIRNLANFLDLSGSRYVGYLSFALNYRFGGLDPFGFHLVNLLIHILNGFLVYSLVLLLFRTVQSSTAHWAAMVAALLFVAHPVQTQAVTYIVQRFASLAALFYLLTVVCYLHWRLALPESKRRYFWYGGALLSTVLAMKTKEISFTLPLMIPLMEAVFFREPARKRWLFVVPFLLTLSIIPLSGMDTLRDPGVGFARETADIGRLDYLFTQFRVIVTYIRLLLCPINQTFYYDYPVYRSLSEPPVFFSLLFLLALFVLAGYLLRHTRPAPFKLMGFGILWLFLTLSSESSIIPIRDVIFEHRLYLPSIGVFLIAGVAWQLAISGKVPILPGRKAFHLLSLGMIILILSTATYQRNRIWRNPMTLWSDIVMKAPNRARGHYGLGYFVYAAQERWDEAIDEYQRALKLAPKYAWVRISLGDAYSEMKRFDEAVAEYRAALMMQPNDSKIRPIAHYNLGNIYAKQERWEGAIEEYRNALKFKPDYVEARNNLGNIYAAQGRWDDAIQEYQAALRLKPGISEVRSNLDNAYRQKIQSP